MKLRIELTAPIYTQGSKRVVFRFSRKAGRKVARIIENDPVKHLEYRTRLQNKMQLVKPAVPLDCALQVRIYLYIPRPKSHYTKTGTHKAGAPELPEYGLDIDKVTRAIFDAGTKRWWIDDSRIASLVIERYFLDTWDKERTVVECVRMSQDWRLRDLFDLLDLFDWQKVRDALLRLKRVLMQ